MYKIMFIAGGRRVSLAKVFERQGFEVSSYELDLQVPIATNHKVYTGLSWNDPNLEKDLKRTINDNCIDLAIPLDCKGVHLVCTTPFSAETCLDKTKLQTFMEINLSSWYPNPVYGKPCIIKPRFGYGSNGIETNLSYHKGLENPETVVIQNKLIGKEYSVDAYFNIKGELVGASPRERLWVSGGEVLESITINSENLVYMTKTIGEKIGLKATPACFQFIDDENGIPYLTEINARAGGGILLSIESGLDVVEYIKNEYLDYKPINKDAVKIEKDVYMTRSFTDHFFRN